MRGVLSIRLLSRQELPQFDVLLAVLDVDTAEGDGDFGAEVAAVDGEDAQVVDNLFNHDVVDAYSAADMGERNRRAAADGSLKIAVVLENAGAGGRYTFLECRCRGDRNHQS